MQIFKKLFPPDVYALFIDIGHYEYNIALYFDLTRRFAALPKQGVINFRSALEEINRDHQETPSMCIRGYMVEEELGSGAFGTVYQVTPHVGPTPRRSARVVHKKGMGWKAHGRL